MQGHLRAVQTAKPLDDEKKAGPITISEYEATAASQTQRLQCPLVGEESS